MSGKYPAGNNKQLPSLKTMQNTHTKTKYNYQLLAAGQAVSQPV
jgi:hypothetical protein